MGIAQNLPCPECVKAGHDLKGNHLLVFDDGNMYCNRSHWHKSGEIYHKKKGDKNPVFEYEINGKIPYTQEQFIELEESGKLKDPLVRALALGGMKEKNRYAICNDDEQEAMDKQYEREVKHFNTLKFRNLVSRGISGPIAKMYGVRTGVNKKGKVVRHYYPKYDFHTSELVGATCRNLPKDFTTGRLGKLWGKTKMFGQETMKEVSKSGARRETLLIVGGACDAMAAQQLLCEGRSKGKWENQLYHVWSVQNGEAGITEIVDNFKAINKFKRVIFGFDADKDGQALNLKCYRLLRDKAVILTYPDGCKDANQCLDDDRGEEFRDAWWKADKPEVSSIKTVADLYDDAIEDPVMGLSLPWPTMTRHTFGIRPNNLYTIGGGPGVGKTEIAKEVIQWITDHHKKLVGIIFMEEPAKYTVRVLAGKWINKKLHLPRNNQKKGHPDYDEGRNYTKEQATKAVRDLRTSDRIRIAECAGDTGIDNILALTEELMALGCEYVFIDNLTTISHKGKEGTVNAIDESMKRIGTYMQENPVSIFLLSHLSKPQDPRIPFEEGGTVRLGDFRGSQSIAFWSTFMLAVERNTQGDKEERLLTYLRIVKDRLTGMSTGEVVEIRGDIKTGRLKETGNTYEHQGSTKPSTKLEDKRSKKDKGREHASKAQKEKLKKKAKGKKQKKPVF